MKILFNLCYKYLLANCNADGVAKSDIHGKIVNQLLKDRYPNQDSLFYSFYASKLRQSTREITDYLIEKLGCQFGFEAISRPTMRQKAMELLVLFEKHIDNQNYELR